MITDLCEPVSDVFAFTRRYNFLGYNSGTKITIWITANKYVTDREEKIVQIIDLLSNYHPRENIDVAFYKRDVDAGIYDLTKIPKMINLTIINCNATESGIFDAGTWVYTTEFRDTTQLLAYDYYGFYTDNSGYQLSLIDTDYVVQKGDTWHSIARRHGMPLNDLLALNRANKNEKIYAGQIVRIA